jgi:two-component system chemotaxis response regulator CheV
MAGLLEGIDQRTQLAGHNRFELLLFKLAGSQRFGINVFKVQEVIQCPALTQIPQAHSVVCGVAHLRGRTIPILDLAMAIGLPELKRDSSNFVIVTEYNRSVQGFMVDAVDRIINIGWSSVKAPPKGAGKEGYLTAVTQIDDQLIEVIDVEKVMKEVIGGQEDVSEGLIEAEVVKQQNNILIVDDSMVARNQIKKVVEQMGANCSTFKDGQEAWDHLSSMAKEGVDVATHYTMIISDVEMPVMDGYTLASKIKNDPLLKEVYLILHTSLSGVFNTEMVKKVGANQFLPKFSPDDLVKVVQDRMKIVHGL